MKTHSEESFKLEEIAESLRRPWESPAHRAVCMMLLRLAPAAGAIRGAIDGSNSRDEIEPLLQAALPAGLERIAALAALEEALEAARRVIEDKPAVCEHGMDDFVAAEAAGVKKDAFGVGFGLPVPRVQVSLVRVHFTYYRFTGVVYPAFWDREALVWASCPTWRGDLHNGDDPRGYPKTWGSKCEIEARDIGWRLRVPVFVVDHVHGRWAECSPNYPNREGAGIAASVDYLRMGDIGQWPQ